MDDLCRTVARLRAPDGCPWDREQTHASLCACLIEEAAEVLDTIDRADWPHLQEELGDLLLQVVMHAQMAEEEERFSFEDVATGINEKLIRRHPHVFGSECGSLAHGEDVLKRWEELKAAERGGREPVFKDLPPSLPALRFAFDVYKRIRKKALPAENEVDVAAISALSETLDEDMAGQKLFEWAAACREAGIDPESALRRYTNRVQSIIEHRVGKGEWAETH